MLIVSQSGETYDCYQALQRLRRLQRAGTGVAHIGVVNHPGSLIARETSCGVYLNAGREVGVAATKSFTAQVVALTLVALWFAQLRPEPNQTLLREHRSELERLPARMADHMARLRVAAEALAPVLSVERSLLLLGRGPGLSLARESALKIKELAYVQAEAFAGGALKHGPLALLAPGLPVFVHIWTGPKYRAMLSTCEEIHSRQGRVFALTNCQALEDDPPDYVERLVRIDADHAYSSSLLGCIFYQWLSYYMALQKNINPDQPRNIAKSVTVE